MRVGAWCERGRSVERGWVDSFERSNGRRRLARRWRGARRGGAPPPHLVEHQVYDDQVDVLAPRPHLVALGRAVVPTLLTADRVGARRVVMRDRHGVHHDGLVANHFHELVVERAVGRMVLKSTARSQQSAGLMRPAQSRTEKMLRIWLSCRAASGSASGSASGRCGGCQSPSRRAGEARGLSTGMRGGGVGHASSRSVWKRP
mmetsp:Transcript_76544/g.219602  ORF Transcript_76544/g.219602 Transcript_76544/m.219602 type:complete len:203 (+) Transcript_76544:775-1383(+)